MHHFREKVHVVIMDYAAEEAHQMKKIHAIKQAGMETVVVICQI